jgi:branched-chain amino acid transport system permease protein
MMNKTSMIALALLLISAVYPFFVDSAWLAVGTTFLVFSVVAFSQDIILGRAGVFHMGHAMFFGLGA